VDFVATVLIGEDADDLAALYTILVGRRGHLVRVERDGAATLAAARAMRPDLLILDVQLSGLSGLDVCRAVRADPHLCTLPVLMVSGLGMVSEIDDGIAAGASRYLVKPFANAELVSTVLALLEGHDSAGQGQPLQPC
jgi:DNA-binding response OmpR family regulator